MWKNRAQQNIWNRDTRTSSRNGKRSIQLNGLESRFEIINKNIKELDNIFEKNSFDFIVTNPPYKN